MWQLYQVNAWLLLIFAVCMLAVARISAAQASLPDDHDDVFKAPDASLLHEQVLQIPGDPDNRVALVMTVYTPPGSGPFPLAVMNHGSTGNMPTEQQPRYRLTFSAYYFLSRGYAVALPMMRGYAGSGGHLHAHGCNDVQTGIDAAKDIRAAINYMKQQPYIDGSQIVVAGQSFGGWNTLALGTLNVPNVKGLVSFAGGMKASDCSDPDGAIIAAAGALGTRVSTPSIWFFGDNDAVFATPVWHAMFQRFSAEGSPAELVAYGSFGTNSHNLLGSGEGLPLWVPKLDAFLAKVGLPSTLVHPEYLPQAPPPPSHYAAIDDIQAVPYLGPRDAAIYQAFLAKPLPRAFAIGSRSAAIGSGGFDPIAYAMRRCAQQSNNCRLYAVDDNVVYVRPTQAPPPTHFAALDDVAAVPHVNDSGRAGYQKFLTLRRPRAFAISQSGGWVAADVGTDPVAFALTRCNALYHDCRLYAVDGDVVW